jgi:hypothetical protein
MVEMHLVESSCVRAIGYDEAGRRLWVEFHSSPDPYIYLAVPPEVYREFVSAESQGEYVNLKIKPFYEVEHHRLPVAASV